MTYPTAESLNQAFRFTTGMIQNFIKEIDDPAAMVPPNFSANSLNWVVGHIITGRQRAARALGQVDFLPEVVFSRYITGSDPINPESTDAVPLSKLSEYLQASMDVLSEALAQVTDEDLAVVIETRFGPRPVGQHLDGLHWHETYHLGQLELLREVSIQAQR